MRGFVTYVRAVVLSWTIVLSGCAAIQEEMARAEKERQEYWDRRAAVLVTGTPQSEVQAVWGSPVRTSHSASGTATIDTIQYGQCAASPGITTGVIFMTFINGKLSSYYTTQC